MKKITCLFILLLSATVDNQVSVNDAKLLFRTNPKAELKIISHMNHVLKDTDTKEKVEQVTTVYTNGDLSLDKVFEEEMVQFIKSVK